MNKKLIITIITAIVLLISYYIFHIIKYNIFEIIAYFLVGISLVISVLLWIPVISLKLLAKFNLTKPINTATYLGITLFCIAFVIFPLWPYLTVGFNSWNGFGEFILSLPFYALSFIAFACVPTIFLKRKYPILLKLLILIIIGITAGLFMANIITKIQTKNLPSKNEQTLNQLNNIKKHTNKDNQEGYSTYTLEF